MEKGRVSWQMPKALLEDLERAKRRLRKPKSEIIREAVREYLEKHLAEEEKLTQEELKGLLEGLKNKMEGKVMSLQEVRRGLKGRANP